MTFGTASGVANRLRCGPDHRHHPHPLSLIRHGDELLPVPTPFHDRRYPTERPTDQTKSLMAVTSDRNLTPAPRTRARLRRNALAVLVDPGRGHGPRSWQEQRTLAHEDGMSVGPGPPGPI
jgi:hypothetical protein